jgi:hypothetical protein
MFERKPFCLVALLFLLGTISHAVFINWFFSRKGQIALQKHLDLYGELPPNSRRIDIPKEDFPPESRLIKGRKYLDVSRPEWQDMEPIFKLVKEVTAGRDKK